MSTTYSKQGVIERMTKVSDRMTHLKKFATLTREQEAEYDKLYDELLCEGGLRDRLKQCEAEERAQRATDLGRLQSAIRDGSAQLEAGDGGDTYAQPRATGSTIDDTLNGRRGGTAERDRAKRVVETAHRSGQLPDHAAEAVERLVSDDNPFAGGLSARWAAATGDPAYARAFAHVLANPERGHLMWSGEEQAAFQRVERFRSEQRAMSLTDANGGYLVPLTLDPAILLTSAGSINPLRRVSRVVQTATDSWVGITSAGATAEWKAEAAEAADGSPTVDDVPIPVHFGDSFVPYSFEVGMDALNFLSELQKVLVDAADQLQATAFTTGSGSGQPKGIITALAGTASEINTTGTEALDASDPFALQNALPARFSADAVFMSHIATANAYRQMETSNGALKFPELREAPPRLLGKTWLENSNMDGAINPAATANNYALVYGDFGRGFVIADRIGTTLELIPHLTGENGRPTGQRGAFLWFRTGSDCVIPNAFRLLDVPTTA